MRLTLLVIVICCHIAGCINRQNETNIDLFLSHLKNSDLDTVIFSQGFFSDTLKAKKDKHLFYYSSLRQIQVMVRNSDSYEIKPIEDKRIRVSNGHYEFYQVKFYSSRKLDSLYVITSNRGIEGLHVLLKGDNIVSWW